MPKHIGLLLIVGLVLAACGAGSGPAAAQPLPKGAAARTIATESKLLDSSGEAGMPGAGDLAPDFEYTLSDGVPRKLSDLRGKRVVLNFWATWCEPCRAEMPDLQKVVDTYGGSVVVLGVNKLEAAAVIPPFADELKVNFPLIANTKGDISNRYAARNIPTSFFINTDGTVGFRHIGVMNYDYMRQHLDQLK